MSQKPAVELKTYSRAKNSTLKMKHLISAPKDSLQASIGSSKLNLTTSPQPQINRIRRKMQEDGRLRFIPISAPIEEQISLSQPNRRTAEKLIEDEKTKIHQKTQKQDKRSAV